jgi:hypothetical protein
VLSDVEAPQDASVGADMFVIGIGAIQVVRGG